MYINNGYQSQEDSTAAIRVSSAKYNLANQRKLARSAWRHR